MSKQIASMKVYIQHLEKENKQLKELLKLSSDEMKIMNHRLQLRGHIVRLIEKIDELIKEK